MRRLFLFAALFLAGFLTVVILAAFGQFEPDKPLGTLLGLGDSDRHVAEAPKEGGPPEAAPEESPQPAAKLEQPDVVEPKPAEEAVEKPEQPVEKAGAFASS